MSRNAQSGRRKAGWLLPALCLCRAVLAGEPLESSGFSLLTTGSPPARVLLVQDSKATEAFQPQPEVVQAMLDRALLRFTGKGSIGEAWRQIVTTQDVVGIKVYSLPGPNSGTRPAVVAAVIRGLLAAGVPATNIIIWDKHVADLRMAGFSELAERYHVRIAGSIQAGYDESTFYESAILGNLVWGDLEFGRMGSAAGRKSHVTRLLTGRITRIINVAPLLNHNLAGVSGNLFSLCSGSVDNFARFESDPARLAVAIPEIYAVPAIGDRVALSIVDALICQYEGGERGLLHYSAALNQVRLSRDPVALDVLSLEELDRQRKMAQAPPAKSNRNLYDNAALLELGVSEVKKIRLESLKASE